MQETDAPRPQRLWPLPLTRTLVILALVLVAATMLVAQRVAATDAAPATEVGAYLAQAGEQYGIPAASLVMVEDGQKVLTENWGTLADGSPATADTAYLIGSLSKPLTALAVVLLLEDGAIGLDDTVDTHLPGFEYTSADGSRITIEHLLRQTSGISAYDSLEVTDGDYPASGGISQAVSRLSGVTLQSQPGAEYEYASANYLLLGAVIESVTGRPFAEVMAERVFQPLGMTDTFASHDAARAAGYQPGYQSWFGHPVRSSDFYDNSGAPYGYTISTANDLAAFLTFMQSGGDLLEESGLRLLQTLPAEPGTYGYGWRYAADEGLFFHGGATPHSRAEMFYDPEHKVSGVLLTNKYHTLEDQQVSTVLAGVRAIHEGSAAEQLTDQKHPVQWTLAVTLLLVVLLLVSSVRRLLRGKPAVRHRVLRIASAVLLAAASAGLIPLLSYAMETPWHSIRLFAPDVALLVLSLAVMLAAHAVVLLVGAVSTARGGLQRKEA